MKTIAVGAAALGLGMACGLVGCQTAQKEPQVSLDILLNAKFTPPGQATKPQPKPAPQPAAGKKVARKAPPKPVAARPVPAPATKPAPRKIAKLPVKRAPQPAAPTKVERKTRPRPAPAPKKVANMPVKPVAKPAAKPTAKPSPAPAKHKREARPKFEVPKEAGADVWQAPVLMKPEAWRVETWGNPGTVKAQDKEIILLAAGGEKDKTAFSVQVLGDLSGRGKVLIDLRNMNREDVDVAFAFLTKEKDYNYIETPAMSIKPGLNRNVVVDLKAKDFKCAQTQWKHTSTAKGLDKVTSFVVLVYSKKKAQIGISNIRFVK